MKIFTFFLLIILTGCNHVHLTPEAREKQCVEYGHKKGTPEFGECMQKERQMAHDFWWGNGD